MSLKLLQANLNHSREVQNLFVHNLTESDFAIGIAAEPYRVPPGSPSWAGNRSGSVAITWRWVPGRPLCSPLEEGDCHVAVLWGSIAVTGVYLPPQRESRPIRDVARRPGRLCQAPRIAAVPGRQGL